MKKSELKKIAKNWWIQFRKEKGIPKWYPKRDYPPYHPIGLYKSKWKKRMSRWWDGYFALISHINGGYTKIEDLKDYEAFKKEIRFFYGWYENIY